MSDNIPLEIQAEIIKRLPVKPIIQFRSVSKPWKSLIDSSKFIANYTVPHSQPQHLFVSYFDPQAHNEIQQKYISIIDDNTFPQQKLSLTVPMFINQFEKPMIAGSSQGLLCIYGYVYSTESFRAMTAVIWNPSIRKSVTIDVPKVLSSPYETVVGFGVCPSTNDPKLVKITSNLDLTMTLPISSVRLEVEVFTLSSGVWRKVLVNPNCRTIKFMTNQVCIDRFIYWHAYDMINVDGKFQWKKIIMSFDITSEEVTKIHIPDSLAQSGDIDVFICKLRESLALAVIEDNFQDNKSDYGVWMMEDGDTNSFKRLYTFNTNKPDETFENILGFRKNGEPIIVVISDDEELDKDTAFEPYVYEPHSKSSNYIGIFGEGLSFYVCSYAETLLLLDH